MTTEPISSEQIFQAEPQVITTLVDCPYCGSKAILFSHTIQTFCYHCGLPVTNLDTDGLYYSVATPASDAPEQA